MRENGYYLVIFQGEHYIARYIKNCWSLAGDINIYYDEDFDFINETKCLWYI